MRVLGLVPEHVWRRRPERIVEFERLLVEEGIAVLKCFLLRRPSPPWYVIRADRNWVRSFAVATVRVGALRRLDPQFAAT